MNIVKVEANISISFKEELSKMEDITNFSNLYSTETKEIYFEISIDKN